MVEDGYQRLEEPIEAYSNLEKHMSSVREPPNKEIKKIGQTAKNL